MDRIIRFERIDPVSTTGGSTDLNRLTNWISSLFPKQIYMSSNLIRFTNKN